jgi:peptide/nickel transport system substrate-binding protein
VKSHRVLLLALLSLLAACGRPADRRGNTVMFASGADLQSANPLITVHPLAKQVQRYVLLTTLVQYDSALVPRPYLARSFEWSADSTVLTFRFHRMLRWHDGKPTTSRDAAWTLSAARNPATGYPRLSDLADLVEIADPDDSTLVLTFRSAPGKIPDVLTDLAILPAHLLDTVDLTRIRSAAWNDRPVGNGPFRFVSHQTNRRWVFERNPEFPAEMGGPPSLERLVIAVVDEPTTKLAALASGELDFAGIQPAHAEFVRKNPSLEVLSYPLLFTYGIVFNTRVAPFNNPQARRAVNWSVDRQSIVDGYIYGFGTVASGPVPPGIPGGIETSGSGLFLDSAAAALGGQPMSFELLTVGSGEAALEQMIQAQLAKVGITVTIRQLELTAFLDRVNARRPDFQAAVLGTSGDLGLGHVTTLADLAGIKVPPADHRAAQRIFADSVPVAFLYHARGVQGMNRRVEQVRMDLRGELAGIGQWGTRLHE